MYADMLRRQGIIYSPGVVDLPEAMELMAELYPDALITTNELERWADMVRSRPALQKWVADPA